MPTNRKPRIGVLVVAYNAATTLVETLDRIPLDFRERIAEIIVLDDASTDETHKVAQTWCDRSGNHLRTVVRHTKNLGYGGNQKAAYVLAMQRGLDIVVLLHGDGQYAPELLSEMVAPLERGECDAVFGSRMMIEGAAKRGGMPLYKRLGNRVLTRFENKLLGTELTEFHSGYRAYSVRALRDIPFENNTDDFDFDTQIIIQLVHAGKRIVEIPIPVYYGEEICYVNGLKYAKDVVADVIEYRLASKGLGTADWIRVSDEYAFKDGDGSSHAIILEAMEGLPPSRVLDVGCSGGQLSEAMRDRGHEVTGVDAIEVLGVRERVDKFVCVDLTQGVPAEVGGGFDLIVAGDIIEHLPRPTDTLRQLKRLLRPGGQLVLSVPNFGHWYPRFRVCTGLFGYDRRGILDETHLRFFTRRILRRLVRRCGLDILEERSTGLPLGILPAHDRGALRALHDVDTTLVRLWPTMFSYQWVVRLTPHAEEALLVESR